MERLGEIKRNNQGSLMKIIEYNSYADITVQFLDYPYICHSRYGEFKNGMIKNMGRDKIALLANVLQLPPVAFVPGGLSHEYSYDEQRLINIYRKLSDHGKELLHERAQELCILYNEGEKSNDTSNSSVG